MSGALFVLLDQQVFQQKNPVHHQKKMEQSSFVKNLSLIKLSLYQWNLSQKMPIQVRCRMKPYQMFEHFVFAAPVPVPG